MPSKRRLLRIFVTVFVVVAIAGFGAFSTFLYNPFEGSYEFQLASLVPRDVDFYVAKSDLRADFDPFPRPVFLDELEKSPRAKAFREHPRVAELVAGLGVEQAVARLDEALATLPVQVDPLQVFGGEDLAIAGYLREGDLSQPDWAVYARTSTLGKIGAELLRYPDLIGLSGQGLVVEEVGDAVSIEGGQLPRKLFVKRLKDVIVVATAGELVQQAIVFAGTSRGQDSFGQSAKYGDHIARREREGDELEVYAEARTLTQGLKLPENWIDPYADNLAEAVLGKLLQTSAIREISGTLGFGEGIDLRLHGGLSSESMTPVQKRFYRVRGFDKAQIKDVASAVPADVGLFAYAHGDIGDILRETLRSVDNDALLSNLGEVVRNVWGHSEITLLIDDLDTAFKDRFAFVARNDDYPDEGETGPPHNDLPTPAWALILWTNDGAKIEELRSRAIARQAQLGIKGREPGSKGVFENRVRGGYKVTEYWSEIIPGTGHIATVDLEDFYIVSNNHQMLGAMVKTYFEGGAEWPRLSEKPYFQTLVNTGLPSSNVMVWLDPRAVGTTTREIVRETAQLAADDIDWGVERPRIEKEILRERFPGETWGALSPEVEQQLAILADQAAAEYRSAHVAERAPALRERAEATLEALEATNGTFLELALDEKAFELFLRVVVPFD